MVSTGSGGPWYEWGDAIVYDDPEMENVRYADRPKPKEIRKLLFDLDPHCYWCGCLTKWIDKNGGTFPMDAATIDHVYSKYTQEERRATGNPKVLACWKCNNERSQKETDALDREELRLRSKQHKYKEN